jgi:D-sedoheptulose 7-phosphate isomerase
VDGIARDYLGRLSRVIESCDVASMDRAVEMVRQAWESGRQIITLGNGGSAMTALHYITDWNKMIHLSTGRPFRGRTLVDNTGLLTAYSNDMAYADVFLEQLKNLSQPEDLVVAISGSGNSENVIRAVTYANETGCKTLGLCGFGGGRLKSCAQHSIWVMVNDMQLCEDIHAIFGHMVMQSICKPS